MSQIKLIVGLGNPGDQYAHTRHNAGEWLINKLSDYHNFRLTPETKFSAKVARGFIANKEVRLVIPTTFMNLSGKAVGAIANFYRIEPEQIVIIHDELDLPPGVAKIKQGGGHGGHNGLKDIIAALGNNKNFYRLRLGIGHPGNKNLVSGYVLTKPPQNELSLIEKAIDESALCIEVLLKDGINQAMNRLNGFKA